jgi:hypothetical protein
MNTAQVAQTGDNPNKAGTGKGNPSAWKAGDVTWTKGGPQRVNSTDDGPRLTMKEKLAKLSPVQRKKLAAKLKKKIAAKK